MAEAFATSAASNLVSKLGEYLFAPIGRQFGYVLCYKSYVQDLENGVEKLKNARKRVQSSVDEAFYDGKPIHTDIEKWLDSVENKANEAQNLLTQGESAKIACFRGWLPNPIVRHPIGRKVKKMTRVIQELHAETANSNFQKVYYENLPKGIVTATISVARSIDKKEGVLESRALVIEDVMKAITDDKIRVVGVYGPGGVGKSKLLEDIERRVKKEKLFDVVAMANISRDPDLKTIQGDVADALGLKLMNVETARGRADRLRERLECNHEKKILIILDNLWRKLELKDVGIPCCDDNKVTCCKLLLSSRNREVLRIDMFSDREFRLNELDDGEARRLFERITGDKVHDPEFKSLVDGVVKNCGGLPLFIISRAKRLRRGLPAAWRNALTIEGSDLKSLVELNFNDVNNVRIQSLFLIYAISHRRISLRDALVYCLGLDLFDNFSKTVEDARDRLIMDLECLQDSSLLLDSDVTKEIRMHDIIANVAISIASTKWNALVGRVDCGFKKWSKDELIKCTVISFPHVGIDELPEILDCPNLRMFILYEHNQSLKIPEPFFESMEKLQVLDLARLSITSLPSSIQFLKNLKSLCLDFCHLEDVTDLGKLKALQFLSLTKSTIARLPKEIGELIELRFLDLTGCTGLKVIEPGVLGSLINLEELRMKNSFDKWEAEDEESQSNASLTELKNMDKLSTLDIAIPHSSYLSRDLPFGKLNKHKIQIGGVWDWSGEYKESRTLKLKLDSSNLLIAEWVLNCLQKTQDLHLDGLQHGVDSIHNLCIEGFQELKHLHVQNSPSFQNVVCSIENVECTTFIALQSLFLENLNNLKKICRGYLARESFSKLKILKVDNCGEIKQLFPSSMKRIILQLEEIEISNCHLMQQIVADAEVDEDGDEIYDDTKVKSCNLRRLTLRNLPNMVSFYKTGDDSVDFFNGQQILFPSLEELIVVSCGLMKIWHNELSKESFRKLASITIQDCENLSHIFPSNVIEVFQSLKMIEVVNCTSLESLMEHDAVNTKKRPKHLVFLNLDKVKLWDLPRLDALVTSSSQATLSLPSLITISLRNCHSLRYLFTYDTSETLDKLEMLDVSDCNKMQEVVAMEESEERKLKAMKFSRLQTLKLCSLKSLISFSSGSCAFEFPSLTNLSILECTKLKAFILRLPVPRVETTNEGTAGSNESPHSLFDDKVLFLSLEKLTLVSCGLMKIWHNELSEESFRKLAFITIRDCKNLSHIFPSNMIEVFQSLKMIEVVNCTSLESLMEHVAVNTKKRPKSLVFLNLNKVKLWDLPRLDALVTSRSQATLSLPSLITVSLRNCHSLRYLFTYDTFGTLDKL